MGKLLFSLFSVAWESQQSISRNLGKWLDGAPALSAVLLGLDG
jgi:hypothetical protein